MKASNSSVPKGNEALQPSDPAALRVEHSPLRRGLKFDNGNGVVGVEGRPDKVQYDLSRAHQLRKPNGL